MSEHPDKLTDILSDTSFSPYISTVRTIPAKEGIYSPFPPELDSGLREALRRRGVTGLYSHQAEAWKHIRAGRHTVVVTPTASGKTLCYNLPVMQALAEDPKARALYLFPTKALSQDQQSELNEIVLAPEGTADVPPVHVSTYDGDTPQSVRSSARENAHIVISNPDMLHAGILPNHPRWIRFFSSLKYVVVDEMHTYRGVFGSHVANVIRRVRRIAAQYGSDPVFIFCSATIGNPSQLAEMLLGGRVVLVDRNGAPSGEKTVVLYNPPVVDAVQGIRRSVMSEGQRWALAFLRRGIKTILFAHSRVRTEVIASYIVQSLKNVYNGNEDIRVEPYRGGLLPLERRGIEKGLRDGSIQGVVSTNALELGIDIGGLDASVVAGFPGSFSSFWQQAGRAGRRQTRSVAVFIASSSPLDQYIIGHPDYFFDRPPENAYIDPDNPYVFSDHIKAAAYELPFTDGETAAAQDAPGARKNFFGCHAEEALSYLESEGVLRHTGGRWHWSDRSYPAEGISLRSFTADNIVIIDTTKGRNSVIGEMDRPSAKELIYPNAVYIHLGRQYLVDTLDVPNRKCLVHEADVNYFTDAVVKTDIQVLSEDGENIVRAANGGAFFRIVSGDMLIRTQATKFKKLKFRTHENIGFGEVAMEPEETESRGAVLVFDFSPEDPDTENADISAGGFLRRIEAEGPSGGELTASAMVLSALGNLVRSAAPFYLLCDRRDIGISSRVRDPHFGAPALYVFDRAPGGSGLSEALVPKLPLVLKLCSDAVSGCGCRGGCPSCIGAEIQDRRIKQYTAGFLQMLTDRIAAEADI